MGSYLKKINNKRPKKANNETLETGDETVGNVEEEEEKEKRQWNINPIEHILRFGRSPKPKRIIL